jgi:hypothetical protein
MDVPGPDLDPLKLVAAPANISCRDGDLAVLAHGPGEIRAVHRNVRQLQGQLMPRKPERPLFPTSQERAAATMIVNGSPGRVPGGGMPSEAAAAEDVDRTPAQVRLHSPAQER